MGSGTPTELGTNPPEEVSVIDPSLVKEVLRNFVGGMSGRVNLVRVEGYAEPLVWKQINTELSSKHDILQEAKILTYLNKKKVPGVVQLVGVSPDTDKFPAIFKKFASGLNLKELREVAYTTQDPQGISALSKSCLEMLQTVAAVHEAGVVIADAKPEDVVQTTVQTPDGRTVTQTVLIDFASAYIKGDPAVINRTKRTTETHDVWNYLNLALQYGLGLPKLPQLPGAKQFAQWLQTTGAPVPPEALKACQSLIAATASDSKTSYTARQLLADLGPIFAARILPEVPQLPPEQVTTLIKERLEAESDLRGVARVDPIRFLELVRLRTGTVPGTDTWAAEEARIEVSQQYLNFYFRNFQTAFSNGHLDWSDVDNYLDGELPFGRKPSVIGPARLKTFLETEFPGVDISQLPPTDPRYQAGRELLRTTLMLTRLGQYRTYASRTFPDEASQERARVIISGWVDHIRAAQVQQIAALDVLKSHP